MKNKGITLIALVITIIILLILAGVTIGIATNGTGLFEKAKEATQKYQNAQINEETEIAKYSNEIDSYISGSRDEYVNYSEKEQVIGNWINGEKLYRKAYEIDVSFSSTHKEESKTANLSDADKIVKIDAVCYDGDYNICAYADNGGKNYCFIFYRSSSDEFKVKCDTNYNITKIFVIVEYTKKDE